MLNDNKDFIIVILLVALTCAVTQIFLINNQRKNASLPEKKEIKRVEFKVDKSLSNRTKPGTEIFKDFESLDKAFYLNLQDCKPSELATETELEYSIYGIKDNKCSFQHRMDFYVTDCALPLDVTKKYAEDGLKISKELETLKASGKSGFVKSGEYISDINLNSGYCKSYSTTRHSK